MVFNYLTKSVRLFVNRHNLLLAFLFNDDAFLMLVCHRMYTGFTNTDAACCKGPCNEQFGAPCGNRREYWFWDVGHTTEKAAKLAAAAFYDGERQFTTPLNFKRLMGIHWR